jgi:hypothetical protein
VDFSNFDDEYRAEFDLFATIFINDSVRGVGGQLGQFQWDLNNELEMNDKGNNELELNGNSEVEMNDKGNNDFQNNNVYNCNNLNINSICDSNEIYYEDYELLSVADTVMNNSDES